MAWSWRGEVGWRSGRRIKSLEMEAGTEAEVEVEVGVVVEVEVEVERGVVLGEAQCDESSPNAAANKRLHDRHVCCQTGSAVVRQSKPAPGRCVVLR
jgi:hypothetical protein